MLLVLGAALGMSYLSTPPPPDPVEVKFDKVYTVQMDVLDVEKVPVYVVKAIHQTLDATQDVTDNDDLVAEVNTPELLRTRPCKEIRYYRETHLQKNLRDWSPEYNLPPAIGLRS